MSETKIINARLADGTVCECSLEIVHPPQCTLAFSGAGIESGEFIARDLFEAFVSLRERLEQSGVMILCEGARANVFPSAMSRSTGGGRMAYVAELGKPTRSELVDIFAPAEAALVASVADQKAFRKLWADSLKS